MKQPKPDITPLVVVVVGAILFLMAYLYLREDPRCDRGCKNRLDHLLLHVLLNRGVGPTDIIGIGEEALNLSMVPLYNEELYANWWERRTIS